MLEEVANEIAQEVFEAALEQKMEEINETLTELRERDIELGMNTYEELYEK